MKSIMQIHVDSMLNRIRYQCEDDFEDLKSQSVVDALEYDHDYADFLTRDLIERTQASLSDHSSMAALLHMNSIDDDTFSAAKAAICGCTRDLHYMEIAELDRTILALALFLKAHPAHSGAFEPAENETVQAA